MTKLQGKKTYIGGGRKGRNTETLPRHAEMVLGKYQSSTRIKTGSEHERKEEKLIHQ